MQRRRQGTKETFGGNIEQKQENMCRIGCRNIGGFPSEDNHSEKYNALQAESAENEFGI